MDPFLLMLIFMLLVFVAMNYFGKRKTAQIREQRQAAIVIGNPVRTHSGFFGIVVDIDGDTVTLESPSGAETMWHRDAIFGAQEPPLAALDDAADDESSDESRPEDRTQ